MTVNWRRWLPWVVVASGLLAYANSFSGPFIFDDIAAIVENPSIRHLWPLPKALVAPDRCSMSGRPLVNYTFGINFALQGLQVGGYHAVNVAIHLLAGLVLLGVVRRTAERWKPGPAAAGLGGAVALLWVLHPLQTDTVDYLTQRTEGLLGLFLLLTLYAAIRSFNSPHPVRWQWTAVVACAIGMGCKEIMIVAPLLVLLYDYIFVTGSPGRSLRQRPWLYAGLAVTWLIVGVTIHLKHYAPEEFAHAKLGGGFNYVSPWEYAKMQCTVLVHYLRLAVWPHPLVIDYDDWPRVASVWSIVPQGALIVGLVVVTAWGCYRRRWWGFLGAWFFLILAPTSSFLPLGTEVAAERRMYLPLAAVLVLVVVALGRSRKWIVPVIAIGLGMLTWQRNADYRSAESIWRDAVAKRPGNPRAHYNLGRTLSLSGQIQGATGEYEQALRINPDYADAHNNLGELLTAAGQTEEAIKHYELALQIRPDLVEAQNNLGNALLRAGKIEEAIGHYEQALRINPDLPEIYNNLGNALMQAGKTQEAIGRFEQALRIRPDYAEAHNNLGIVLLQTGKTKKAIEQFVQALHKQDFAGAYYNLGNALLREGQTQAAIGQFEQALRLRPGFPEAQQALEQAQKKSNQSNP